MSLLSHYFPSPIFIRTLNHFIIKRNMSIPSFKLNTKSAPFEIPAIGLGTWKSEPGKVAEAVKVALQNGYRHIDCAWAYQNEAEVGQGIKESGVDRKDIFITSKLWSGRHRDAEVATDETLTKLGTDYLDLLLIHWPWALIPDGKGTLVPRRPDGTRDVDHSTDVPVDTWATMEKLLKTGKVRAIGVSNFSIPKLERLLANATVVPAVNQVENHPFLPQEELLQFCKSKGILLQSYSPLGSNDGPLLEDEIIVNLAKKHNVEPSNILISYQVHRGVVVLPKSVTPSRIISNFKVVPLDEEDMKTLNNFHNVRGGTKRLLTPDWGVPLEFPDWP